MKVWVAAMIGAVLLLGGGKGGFFIGAANDHGQDRPGFSRNGDRGPFGPGGPNGPGARQLPPFRNGPGNGGR
jgi:hypothetical protein